MYPIFFTLLFAALYALPTANAATVVCPTPVAPKRWFDDNSIIIAATPPDLSHLRDGHGRSGSIGSKGSSSSYLEVSPDRPMPASMEEPPVDSLDSSYVYSQNPVPRCNSTTSQVSTASAGGHSFSGDTVVNELADELVDKLATHTAGMTLDQATSFTEEMFVDDLVEAVAKQIDVQDILKEVIDGATTIALDRAASIELHVRIRALKIDLEDAILRVAYQLPTIPTTRHQSARTILTTMRIKTGSEPVPCNDLRDQQAHLLSCFESLQTCLQSPIDGPQFQTLCTEIKGYFSHQKLDLRTYLPSIVIAERLQSLGTTLYDHKRSYNHLEQSVVLYRSTGCLPATQTVKQLHQQYTARRTTARAIITEEQAISAQLDAQIKVETAAFAKKLAAYKAEQLATLRRRQAPV